MSDFHVWERAADHATFRTNAGGTPAPPGPSMQKFPLCEARPWMACVPHHGWSMRNCMAMDTNGFIHSGDRHALHLRPKADLHSQFFSRPAPLRFTFRSLEASANRVATPS